MARPSRTWCSAPTGRSTARSGRAGTGSRRHRRSAARALTLRSPVEAAWARVAQVRRRRPRPLRATDCPAGPAQAAPEAGRAAGTIVRMAVDGRAGGPHPTDEVPLLTNGDLAAVFHAIGDLLEIKGELVFKTVAYHRAADAIAHSPIEIARAYRAGSQPRIPGVGKAISDKIAELATTGRLAFLDRLHAEVPASLVEVLAIPGLGPKTVKLLWERLRITTLDGLRTALDSGALRDAKGITEKGAQALRLGLEGLDRRSIRMTLGDAERIVGSIVELLGDTLGVVALTPAGSFRRRRETIGDLDILAETTDPGALIERFTAIPPVEHVVGAGPQKKASIRLLRGPA